MNGPIVILAGGTGGHVFVAESLCAELSSCSLLWVGRAGGLEEAAAARVGAEFVAIGFGSPRRLSRLLANLRRLCGDFWRLQGLFHQRQVRLAIGFGGYASVPGGLAALWRRVPLAIHEQNSRPGLANRLLSLWARHIVTAYPEAFAGSARRHLLGIPLRGGHGAEARAPKRYDGAGKDGERRVLVLGGSQGARSINALFPEALAATGAASARCAVRHLCGRGQAAETEGAYERQGLSAAIEEFSDSMHQHYDWADLAVCRGGALTLAELAHHALPAIVLPLPGASAQHQLHNARHYRDAGAAVIVEEGGAAARLAHQLSRLLADEAALAAMSRSMKALSREGAAARFAQLALSCLAASPAHS